MWDYQFNWIYCKVLKCLEDKLVAYVSSDLGSFCMHLCRILNVQLQTCVYILYMVVVSHLCVLDDFDKLHHTYATK